MLWAALLGLTHADSTSNVIFTRSFDPKTVRLRLWPEDQWGLFRESEPVRITATRNTVIRVMSLRGELLREGRALTLKLPVGHYFIETEGDRSQFAVLPGDYHGASFLGTEADKGTDSQYGQKLARVQPAWVRVMGQGYWPRVQPRPDAWEWSALDRVVEANRGRRIIVMAFERPDWLKDEREWIPRYAAYVGAIARRYDGRIHAIEVWNEPWYGDNFPYCLPGSDWVEMLRFYVELLRAAREAIRSESVRIQVVGPAWQNPHWSDATAKFVELGGGELVDAYTFHDYGMSNTPPDKDTRYSPAVVNPSVDKRIAAHRASIGNKPILVDELGLFGKSALGCPEAVAPTFRSNTDWRRGMCRAIKCVVMYRAAGVEALVPHVLPLFAQPPNDNFEIYGWEYSGAEWASPRGPHPKTSAFLMTCHWLNGARFVEQRFLHDRAFLSGWMRDNDTPLVFAWCREGESASLAATGSIRVTDIFGRESGARMLREEPLLFHGASGTPVPKLLDAVAAAVSR